MADAVWPGASKHPPPECGGFLDLRRANRIGFMGQRAPGFTLYAADGEPRTRDRLLAAGPVLFDRAEDDYPASNTWGVTHVPAMFLIEPGLAMTWSSAGFFKRELEELAAVRPRCSSRP